MCSHWRANKETRGSELWWLARPIPACTNNVGSTVWDIVDTPREQVNTRFVLALKQKLQTGQCTLVHAHNGRAALTASVAVHLAGRGRCVLTQHFLQPAHSVRKGWKGRAFCAVHQWVNRHLHHTIAISEAVRACALARGDAAGEADHRSSQWHL